MLELGMNRGYFVYLYIAGQPDSSLIDCTILLNDIDLMCIFVKNAK